MAKILVCDDDREIVEAIEIYLNQEGYEVGKAYNGEEALKKIKENGKILPNKKNARLRNLLTGHRN